MSRRVAVMTALLAFLVAAPAAHAGFSQPAGASGCASASVEGCGPLRGLGTPVAVAWAPDSRFAYAVSGYLESRGGLAVLRRGAGGALRQLSGRSGCFADGVKGCSPVRGLHDTIGVVVTPNGRFLIAASDAEYHHRAALSVFRRDVKTGRLVQLSGARGCVTPTRGRQCGGAAGRALGGASAIALSGDGRVLAVTENEGVTLLHVDDATGALSAVPGACFVAAAFARTGCTTSPAIDNTTGVAVDGDGSTVVATGGIYGEGSLMVLKRGASGAYTASCAGSPFSGPAPCTALSQLATPTAIALTRDGTRAYVATYYETSPEEGSDEYLAGGLLSLDIGPSGTLTALAAGCTAAGGTKPPSSCSAGRGFADATGLALTSAQDGLVVAWGGNSDGPRGNVAQRAAAVERFGVLPDARVLAPDAARGACASAGRAGGCAAGVRGLGAAPAIAAAPDGTSLAVASLGGVVGLEISKP